MLNSNFDLRKFLAESKASTEQIQEATLTEATVMEYIRERMSSMNNEVRSCMREYLERCNEIDMEHEDAHAQLMNALEDFYNKLKAHFEEDEADMEEPLATTDPAQAVELEEGEDEAPFFKHPENMHLDDRSPEEKEEDLEDDSFGSDKDAVEEGEVNEKAEIHTAQDGSKHKLSYNVYVNGEKVANFEDEAKADAEVKRYREEYKDSKDVASSSIFVKRVMDPINEGGDYEPRTKEDLVYQYLRDAWQFGAMKGKDVSPDEDLSTMADSLLANLPDYDSAESPKKDDEESLEETQPRTNTTDYASTPEEREDGTYDISGIMGEEEGVIFTLADILEKKGSLDHIKNKPQLRLKLIDGPFLRKNPDWKGKPLKMLFYDAREGLVSIGWNGKSSKAYPSELVIDVETTNMRETAALNEDIYVDLANHISNTLSISLENAKLIAGLVKIVVNAGSIPAALALLYKNKDKGMIRKMFNTKFAKNVKSAMVGDDE